MAGFAYFHKPVHSGFAGLVVDDPAGRPAAAVVLVLLQAHVARGFKFFNGGADGVAAFRVGSL